MAEKTLKPLVIKVQPKSVPGGVEYKWAPITSQMQSFTKDIITPEIGVDKDGRSTVNIGAIVSGMPTVFARANLFKLALDTITDKRAEAAGLLGFYKSLVDEWRGFIACIALNYENIQVERINLGYSDGKNIRETKNMYEPKGAFGNLLFERKPLWCDQNAVDNAEKTPFIDVILYQGEVVGGTTPDSFLFTSVAYKIREKAPFVSIQNGKFTDPLHSDIQPEQLSLLCGYVSHLVSNIQKFANQYQQLPKFLQPDYSDITSNLTSWKNEIETFAKSKGIKLDEQAPPVTNFRSPFNILFNISTELYGSEGIISEDASSLISPIAFDPDNLLLPDATEIAQIDFGKEGKEPDFLQKRPLLLLQAEIKGQTNQFRYFTLPLTPLALNIFGQTLESLVGLKSLIDSRIRGDYDPVAEKLTVTLTLFTSSKKKINKIKNYKVGNKMQGKDILIWPNFISKKWSRYFIYSEIPHNDAGYQATPFVGDVNDDFFRIITEDNGEPVYLAKGGRNVISDKYKDIIKAKLHVVSSNAVSDIQYKYEIYESNQPFKGVKISHAGKDCGFAIIRYTTDKDDGLPTNNLRLSPNLSPANIGIDFGGSNTSIAYYSQKYGGIVPNSSGSSSAPSELKLKNRRISLFSTDAKNNDERPAVEDEIFFFQNDEIHTNAIKSVLTLHDPRRLVKDSEMQTNESLLAQAIKGGFPCFEKNLPIENASENRYTLGYPRAKEAILVHNMKWSSQEIDSSYKKAYLSSLVLHVYAQLFEEEHIPVSLKWSYPSSMSNNLIQSYIQIWATLGEVNPITESKPLEIYTPVISVNYDTAGANVFSNTQGTSTWANSGQNTPATPQWGAGSAGSVWGNNQPVQQPQSNVTAGWGNTAQSATKLKEIKIDTGPITFNFKSLGNKESLTEACAVANYLANNPSFEKTLDYLTLCFDVGGSTTDISALCPMKGGPNGFGLAMVKQNSIRFAAQRLANATKFSPNFRSVLIEMCERKKITIQGLNKGDNKFTPSTAPYYFEQLIDRLNENDHVPFYQLIAGKCPEMMSVNIYITGLIMYYAGQIAFKLRKDILNSPDKHPGMTDWKPIINITFAGKGARIFDWFKAINPQAAHKYFIDLFIQGFGGNQKAMECLYPGGYQGGAPIRINPTNENGTTNIKYEVSKGLADVTDALLVPTNNEAIEILGEEGFIVLNSQGQKVNLSYDNSITPEMMENIGTYFMSSPAPGQLPCPKFMEFAGIFFQVASSMFGLKMTQQEFMQGFQSMNINSYIKQLPEYRMALDSLQKGESKQFDFVAPIIILEGMKFMEDTLLRGLSK